MNGSISLYLRMDTAHDSNRIPAVCNRSHRNRADSNASSGPIGAARVTGTGPMVNSIHISVINSGLTLPMDSR
ncbi:hypothetical protein [Xenorhabdus bovienii]|uniref:hypothetical protein n=1 Tax=Xenorhabdus bovienii TaxID=40576 RepID=UPI00237C631F|nr:hypothetical protein [Xenorhabdus bovienii]MDE1473201.1 hypothetical protein [Xenorhabdus bovienii]